MKVVPRTTNFSARRCAGMARLSWSRGLENETNFSSPSNLLIGADREIILIPFDALPSRCDQVVIDDLVCLDVCAAERSMVDQRYVVDPMRDQWRRRGIIELERTSRCVEAGALHDVQNF